jgi:hypothetical protein
VTVSSSPDNGHKGQFDIADQASVCNALVKQATTQEVSLDVDARIFGAGGR